jgi:carboxyl-terminal processing protease
VAGAIQDSGRGKLVGMTSYGKGSIQTVAALVDDQGEVRITIARWLTPDGRQIDKVGLEPDVKAEITEDDNQNNFDSQLEKALEVLRSMIS